MPIPSTTQIQNYLALAELIVTTGGVIAGKLKAIFDLTHPGHGLTDAQINALEQAALEDDRRRIAERIAMSQPG